METGPSPGVMGVCVRPSGLHGANSGQAGQQADHLVIISRVKLTCCERQSR